MKPLTTAALAALAAAALLAGEAQAQAKQPAAASWSGCYAGVHAGLVNSSTELGATGSPFSIDGLGAKGEAAGVHAGCDYQMAGFVIGARGEYTFGKTEFKVNPGLFSASLDNSWTVLGRFGVPVHGVLPYVLAGYTHQDTSWSITGASMPEFHGLVLGGGIEMPINANMSLGLEGRWTKFQSESIASTPLTLEPESLAVMATFNVRFGNLPGLK